MFKLSLLQSGGGGAEGPSPGSALIDTDLITSLLKKTRPSRVVEPFLHLLGPEIQKSL